jgi:hypothetical protein
MSKSVVMHEWIGLLIILVGVVSLTGTIWTILQPVSSCGSLSAGSFTTFSTTTVAFSSSSTIEVTQIPPPQPQCPSLVDTVVWNVPGLIIGLAILLFGLWTYKKGKQGIPLISIR